MSQIAPREGNGKDAWRPIALAAAIATIAVGGTVAFQLRQKPLVSSVPAATSSSPAGPASSELSPTTPTSSAAGRSNMASGSVAASGAAELIPPEIYTSPNYAGSWKSQGTVLVGFVTPTAQQEEAVRRLGFRSQPVGRTLAELNTLLGTVARELESARIERWDAEISFPDNSVVLTGSENDRVKIEQAIRGLSGVNFRLTSGSAVESSRMGPETITTQASRTGR